MRQRIGAARLRQRNIIQPLIALLRDQGQFLVNVNLGSIARQDAVHQLLHSRDETVRIERILSE